MIATNNSIYTVGRNESSYRPSFFAYFSIFMDMDTHFIKILTKLTTGEYKMMGLADTASFDRCRASASVVLAESASLTFEQMYDVSSVTVWSPKLTASIANYHVKPIDMSAAALQAAYVLSSSFLS